MATGARTAPTGPQLRVSQVWLGEMMAERVFPLPTDVTLGGHEGVTFVVGDIGLPPAFHLFRATQRGYLLTLGQGMGGELSLGGRTQKVADVVAGGGVLDRAEGAAGAFKAVPVQPGDWGVIHLDGVGEHVMFFQFVAPEPSIAGRSSRGDELLIPAFAFAIVLAALFVSLRWWNFWPDGSGLDLKNSDALLNIVVNRPPPPPPPTPPEKAKADSQLAQAGVEDSQEKTKPVSSEGEEGKAGGKGDRPRERDQNPGDTAPPDPTHAKVMQTGVLVHASKLRMVGSAMPSDRLGNALSRLKGDNNGGGAGYGHGIGTGVGDGEGTGTLTKSNGKGVGGGGTAHADVVTQGKIDSGGTRPPKGVAGGSPHETQVKISTGTAEGDFDGLTRDQVYKAVLARQPAIRACYEKELQRNPNLSGAITLTWHINPDGSVKGAKVKSSTMGNAAVESCMVRRIMDIKFPASADGRDTTVGSFPFVFAGSK
jgi:hypothetical protein